MPAAPGPGDDAPEHDGPRWVRSLRPHDPDHLVLHHALRFTVVMPAALAFGMYVVHDNGFALFAAFGAFAIMAFINLGGPMRTRLWAHVWVVVAGAAGIAIGTLASQNLVAAAVAMAVVAFTLMMVSVFGGLVAGGEPAVMLAFAVAVMVPAPPDQVAMRELGWFFAGVIGTAAVMAVWPVPVRRPVSAALATACHTITDIVTRHAAALAGLDDPSAAPTDDRRAGQDFADALDALFTARERYLTAPARPAGVRQSDRAILMLFDELSRSVQGARMLDRRTTDAPRGAVRDAEVAMAHAVVEAFVLSERLLLTAAGSISAEEVEAAVNRVTRARDAHLAALEAHGCAALRDGATDDVVLDMLDECFPLRVLSFAARNVVANAAIVSATPIEIDDASEIVMVPPRLDARGTAGKALQILRVHLQPHAVWFRNSARGAVALTIAAVVAIGFQLDHGFWIVLGTLSILRTNALGTNRTALEAIIGNLVGFAVATVVVIVTGDNATGLWIIFPVAVFAGGYVPAAVNFIAGQASFAVMVVVLFNLLAPSGLQTGVARIEAVAVGAVVSVIVSALFWPRGASDALRSAVEALYLADTDVLREATDAELGPVAPADGSATPAPATNAHAYADPDEGAVLPARRILDSRARVGAYRRQADEAFAEYLTERGTKRVSIDDWAEVFGIGTALRIVADSLEQVAHLGCRADVGGDARQREAIAVVHAAWDRRITTFATFATRIGMRHDEAHAHRHGRPHDAAETGGTTDAVAPAAVAPRPADPGHMADDVSHALGVSVAAARSRIDMPHDPRTAIDPLLGLAFTAEWLRVMDLLIAELEGPVARVEAKAAIRWWR